MRMGGGWRPRPGVRKNPLRLPRATARGRSAVPGTPSVTAEPGSGGQGRFEWGVSPGEDDENGPT